jgi:hypothetical protein
MTLGFFVGHSVSGFLRTRGTGWKDRLDILIPILESTLNKMKTNLPQRDDIIH